MKNRSQFITLKSITIASSLFLTSCANLPPELQQLSSEVLGQAGVSSSQVNTAFSVNKSLSAVRTELTAEEEYFLGRGVAAMVFDKYQPLRNNALNSYVTKVGRIVAAYSDRPETFIGYRFTVLDSDEVNAFAAPGGFIFITKGLLKIIPDEDGLAAVLAHEIAHIVNNHGVKAIAQANLTEAFMLIGKEAASSYTPAELQLLTDAFGDSVSDVFEKLITKGYSRGQEYDSDEYAVKLAAKAGYNPNALADVLLALEKLEGDGGWFSTHPDPDDRRDELEDYSVAKQSPTPGQEIRARRFNQMIKSLS